MVGRRRGGPALWLPGPSQSASILASVSRWLLVGVGAGAGECEREVGVFKGSPLQAPLLGSLCLSAAASETGLCLTLPPIAAAPPFGARLCPAPPRAPAFGSSARALGSPARGRGAGPAGLPGRSRLQPPPLAFPPLRAAAALGPGPTQDLAWSRGARSQRCAPCEQVEARGSGRGPGSRWGRGRTRARLFVSCSPIAGSKASLPPSRCWHPLGGWGGRVLGSWARRAPGCLWVTEVPGGRSVRGVDVGVETELK